MRSWEERIHRQAQMFEMISAHVLHFDTDIMANVNKIKGLKAEHGLLQSRQQVVDQYITQISTQQESLARLLSSLEDNLRSKLPAEAAGGQPLAPTRMHQRAKVLAVELDELDRQVEDVAQETQTVQSEMYEEPLATVVRVMDAHASALDAIQGQVNSVSQRLRFIESTI